MREEVRTHQYVMTLHAEEEMVDDNLIIYNVESTILSGETIERQKYKDLGQWKYLVKGQALSGDGVMLVGRISVIGKLIWFVVFVGMRAQKPVM